MNQDQGIVPGTGDNNLWAIVLAAGEGRRLASVTHFLYGREVPKQFAALNGDRTLLQQTMARISAMVPPERTVVVVAADRRALAESQLARYPGVQIISQPENVGTGPGVLLPLAVVKAQAPDATVLVTPSDHHIPGQGAFVDALRTAVHASGTGTPTGLILLGAEADAPASDLGWIVPRKTSQGGERANGLQLVESFVEKPSLSVAKQLFRRGGLWNTLVVVGKVSAFWAQAERSLPEQSKLFQRYLRFRAQVGAADERALQSFLGHLYQNMPVADFSRAILQNAAGLAVVRLERSGWCDCGTPERLLKCLDDRAVDKHPRLLQAIMRTIQAENAPPSLSAIPGG